MKCPNPDCGDAITGVIMQLTTDGIIYKEQPGEEVADLSFYPVLGEYDCLMPDTMARCMDCKYEAEVRDFFPGDVNA